MAIEFAAPRRYFVNGCGERVLVGLSVAETFEFEQLDAPSLKESEQVLALETTGASKLREQRWLKLYLKHNDAWQSSLIRRSPRHHEFAAASLNTDHNTVPWTVRS